MRPTPRCKRLQTDYIDLYQMHHIDRETPWDEIWEAFSVLRQQGKVLYFGSSNFAGWHIAQAQASARERNLVGLVSEQSLYNLPGPLRRARGAAGRRALRPRRHPLVAAAGRPARRRPRQAEGRHARPAATRAGRRRRWSRCARPSRASRSSAPTSATHPANVALAWLLTRPAVTAPIIGPRTLDQLTDALESRSWSSAQETLDKLDELFPAPFPNGSKPAPEAYAW